MNLLHGAPRANTSNVAMTLPLQLFIWNVNSTSNLFHEIHFRKDEIILHYTKKMAIQISALSKGTNFKDSGLEQLV